MPTVATDTVTLGLGQTRYGLHGQNLAKSLTAP